MQYKTLLQLDIRALVDLLGSLWRRGCGEECYLSFGELGGHEVVTHATDSEKWECPNVHVESSVSSIKFGGGGAHVHDL